MLNAVRSIEPGELTAYRDQIELLLQVAAGAERPRKKSGLSLALIQKEKENARHRIRVNKNLAQWLDWSAKHVTQISIQIRKRKTPGLQSDRQRAEGHLLLRLKSQFP